MIELNLSKWPDVASSNVTSSMKHLSVVFCRKIYIPNYIEGRNNPQNGENGIWEEYS
ncbi:hypothetical protein GCM10008967_15690 [Bacillus carboniphilus]|uniref:Uncharacterized protein n=1 Tax=Bacillus carboniphilus TaxID=86663 RepID=A0ABN0W5R2_9BACI